jgi:tripartite ATP-independent transporter DctM subunit
MSGAAIALSGFAVMLVLIALRMPVGLAMLVVGSLGYIHLTDTTIFLNYIKTTPYHNFANYTLSVIPLFILMGALAERSGLSTELFHAARAWFGHVRGGLSYSVISACTAFGAICGSSVATTATFGRTALPELRRYGYDAGFATGTIAVGGTLGILVPPSVILVVYSITTEQNIVKLFQAALIPGLLAAAFYFVVIAIVVARKPSLAPPSEPMSTREKLATLLGVLPAILIAIVVVGGIYGGWFTPTEGAAVGAAAMLVIGLGMRRLGFAEIREALIQSAETSALIFIILLGAEVFNAFLALSQLPSDAAQAITSWGLPPYVVLVLLLGFYIILGAVMDELAMILLTLPVFFPIVTSLDFGMPQDEVAIWFGILVLVVVGIGLTAPPIGLNVFVVSAIARTVPIIDTYRWVLPFIAADLLRLALVVAAPGLALFLVRLLA